VLELLSLLYNAFKDMLLNAVQIGAYPISVFHTVAAHINDFRKFSRFSQVFQINTDKCNPNKLINQRDLCLNTNLGITMILFLFLI